MIVQISVLEVERKVLGALVTLMFPPWLTKLPLWLLARVTIGAGEVGHVDGAAKVLTPHRRGQYSRTTTGLRRSEAIDADGC